MSRADITNWEALPLGSLGEFSNGVNFKSEQMGHGIRLINVKDIFSSGTFLNFDSLDLVDLSNQGNIERYFVEKGDIFFVRSSVKRDGIGLVSFAHRTDFETVHCGFVIRFRLKSPKLDSLFLTYLLLSPFYREQIRNLSGGAAIINLSQANLKQLPITYPTLDTQIRIAEILKAYDDLIANNERRIALLEEAMHLLYREWFVHLRFPGWEETAVVDGVPEGWEKRPLGELCDVTMGQSPKSEFYNTDGDGLPFHQGVKDFGDRFISHQTYCTQLNRIAEPGDILFSVRAPVGRMNITLDKIIIGRGLSAMRNRTNFQSFQFYQLQSHFFKEDLIGGGAIFASVTKKRLLEFLMLTPKYDLIQQFEQHSKPVDSQIVNLHLQNQNLREARDAILPRLMSGRIEV